MSGKVFAFALIGLSLMAALFYGIEGDGRRCVYWLAAAVLNLTVTL